MRKKHLILIILLPVLLAIVSVLVFNSLPARKKTPLSTNLFTKQEKIIYEKMPGSAFHSPDATWWGYNQSKIVRFKDKVFAYYIENEDDSNKTASKFVVLKKDGDASWQEGTAFPTSRPGNLLIDSQGVLHAFVFEPFDVKSNDSWGKIIHYFFPNSASGDIKNYQKELVVDNDGKSETANIRIGAAIGADDTMAISFGLTKFNLKYKNQSEHIYYKKPNEAKWNHTFTDGLPHDYYYPFTIVSNNSFHLLSVQDDYNGPGTPLVAYPNIYQKIIYFENQSGKWKQEIIADLTGHSLASTRPRLLEQSDLYQDKSGKTHILYKEFLDPRNAWQTSRIWHLIKQPSGWERKELDVQKNNIGWIRLLEVDDTLYYLATSWNEVYLTKVGSQNWVKLDTPKDVKAIYPYVSTKKGGTKDTEKYVDVLLLGADQREYHNTSHYYLRIPKSEFQKIN